MDINRKEFSKSIIGFLLFFAIMYAGVYGGATLLKNIGTMKIKYPVTEREGVVDNYHGVEIADPYRWLEDDMSERTAEWVKAQNEVTFGYLNSLPQREAIRNRLTELWNYPSQSAPSKRGEWYYISRNSGLQNQSVLYRKRNLADKEEEVFFDPNTLSDDGTVALHAGSFTKDGKYFAYALASAGSDWVEIKVLDTETMKPLADHIKWVKFSGASWTRDGRGFYYSAYDAPKEGDGVYSAQNTNQKVYFHRLGTKQEDDILIFEDKKNPLHYHHGGESEDGKWQFITSAAGTSGTQLLYKRTSEKRWHVLFKGFEYDYMILDCYEDELMVMTNDHAPNCRLVGVNLNTGKKYDIIPESESLLESVGMAGNYLFAEYLIDAQNKIFQHDRKGNLVHEMNIAAFSKAENSGNYYKKRDISSERISPDMITSLNENEIFVFGSNIYGEHNGGASVYALHYFGAINGQSEGLQGQAYAIPTDGVSLKELYAAVCRFCQFATDNPELTFFVTRIGCGTAGWSVYNIAPMFADCANLDNVKLPKEFWDYL